MPLLPKVLVLPFNSASFGSFGICSGNVRNCSGIPEGDTKNSRRKPEGMIPPIRLFTLNCLNKPNQFQKGLKAGKSFVSLRKGIFNVIQRKAFCLQQYHIMK